MPVYQEFLSANEQKAYPLNEAGGRLSDAGSALPDDLLVDARILIPDSLGKFVWLSGVGISPSLVSLVFSAAQDDPHTAGAVLTPYRPVGVVAVSRPVARFASYDIEPQSAGVRGRVTFGGGVVRLQRLFLNLGPTQACLLPLCGSTYPAAAVTSLGKYGLNVGLQDLVRLRGAAGVLQVSLGVRIIDGVERQVALIGVDTTQGDPVASLEQYAGSCRFRPEVGNCPKTPLRDINGVESDCRGNIDLRVTGLNHYAYDGGMILASPLGLAQTCLSKDWSLFPKTDPICDEGSSLAPDPSPSSSSAVPEPLPSDTPSSALPSEFCENFADMIADEMEVVAGAFSVQEFERPTGTTLRRYVSQAGLPVQEQFAVNSYRLADVVAGYSIQGLVRPRVGNTGHLLFGAATSKDFFALGVLLSHPDYPYGAFYLARRVATLGAGGGSDGLGPAGSGYIFVPGSVYDVGEADALPAVDFHLRADVLKSGSFVIVDWEVKWVDGTLKTVTQSFPIDAGPTGLWRTPNNLARIGVGVVGAETEFDNLGLDCSSSWPVS